MNVGSAISLLILIVLVILGYLAWHGRDDGPLGRAEREKELDVFIRTASESELAFRIAQLGAHAHSLRTNKLSFTENWAVNCRACLLVEIRMSRSPGKTLEEILDRAQSDLTSGGWRTHSVRLELEGIQQAHSILQTTRWELTHRT